MLLIFSWHKNTRQKDTNLEYNFLEFVFYLLLVSYQMSFEHKGDIACSSLCILLCQSTAGWKLL